MTVRMTQIVYQRGATASRGNFNSERIDISVTVQVDGENPDEVLKKASDWVKAKLASELKETYLP